MKNCLIILALCLCSFCTRAQTLSMSDLTNLATISVSDANVFLISGKPFKQEYIQKNDEGLIVRHYEGLTAASKSEKVIIGDGIKTKSNSILHSVTYTTTTTKYILSLIAQASSAGLSKNFQGVDSNNNIYIFDNFLYVVHVYLKTDNSEGTVEVQQKDMVE